MKSITIQNVTIPLKEKPCLCNGTDAFFEGDYVTINVYLTNACNGSCNFCSNRDNLSFDFDIYAFKKFIDEVVKKVKIKKITFTGGETGLKTDLLFDCVKYIRSKTDTKIVVCTNGTLLQKYHVREFGMSLIFDQIDNISVSRHHWVTETNNRILGIDFKDDLFKINQMSDFIKKINISCNLMKGYVDTEEKCLKCWNGLQKTKLNKLPL